MPLGLTALMKWTTVRARVRAGLQSPRVVWLLEFETYAVDCSLGPLVRGTSVGVHVLLDVYLGRRVVPT